MTRARFRTRAFRSFMYFSMWTRVFNPRSVGCIWIPAVTLFAWFAVNFPKRWRVMWSWKIALFLYVICFTVFQMLFRWSLKLSWHLKRYLPIESLIFQSHCRREKSVNIVIMYTVCYCYHRLRVYTFYALLFFSTNFFPNKSKPSWLKLHHYKFREMPFPDFLYTWEAFALNCERTRKLLIKLIVKLEKKGR